MPDPPEYAPDRLEWRTVVGHLWRGATEPSPLALGVAVLVAVALFAAATFGITEQRVAGPFHRLLMAGPEDNYTAITSAVLARKHASPTGPEVIVLGDSSTLEAITSDDALQAAIRHATGVTPAVHLLCTGKQRLTDSVRIADQLPAIDGVVVVSVGVFGMSAADGDLREQVEHPLLGLSADAFDDEVRRRGLTPARRRGNYFLDNLAFLGPRMRLILPNLLHGGYELEQHPFLDRPVANDKVWQRFEQLSPALLEAYGRNFDGSLETLDRLVQRLRAAGAVVVLLQPPVNPDHVERVFGAALYAEHRRRLAEFAAAHAVAYLELAAAELNGDEFYDWCHLRSAAAQERVTQVLADAIAPWLRQPLPATEPPR